MNTKYQGKNKLDEIAKVDNEWLVEAEWYEANKHWLEKSRTIAVKVLRTLREKGISQTELAEKMNISRQMVSKLVQGKSNMQLSTICNLEQILGIDLFDYLAVGSIEVERIPSSSFFKPEVKNKTDNLKGSVDYDTEPVANYNVPKRFKLPLAA